MNKVHLVHNLTKNSRVDQRSYVGAFDHIGAASHAAAP